MIAALFVDPAGPYASRSGVDAWSALRDARLYAGPWPVVAHPPCERWGRYWGGGPMLHGTPHQKRLGDDDGCFAAALAAVRLWGGVLEHPEGSHAWRWFGLAMPPRMGGWVPAGDGLGWTICVEQGHYGHRARKATWLYAAGLPREALPELARGPSVGERLDEGFHSREERQARRAAGQKPIRRLSARERVLTPEPFVKVLLMIAARVPTPPLSLSQLAIIQSMAKLTALDVCCGSRMMWFDKNHPGVVFGDRRHETLVITDRSHGRADGQRLLRIEPGVLFDFRALPFADGTFPLVAFDPPHLERAGPRSWMAAKYGRLGPDWRADLAIGFAECFRVLRTSGTLVFKWSESHVRLSEVLALTPHRPLFGNTSGKKAGTHWLVFSKLQ